MIDVKVQPEEHVSWVYHPVLGVYTRPGYAMHGSILLQYPELYETPGPGHPAGRHFDPARGYTCIDRKHHRLIFIKYDQIVAPIPADAAMIDEKIREELKLSKTYVTELHGERRLWMNDVGFKFVPYQH